MAKKFLALFILFVFGTLQGWLSLVSCLPALSQTSPLWWEIKLVLTAKGDYKVEESRTSYSGNYSFTISWTGTLEKDDVDYLLYHSNCKLLEWEAQEGVSQPESLKHLKTDDFVDKPSFKLIYILKKGEDLHFNFIVEGFSVPQSESADRFYLCLPSSAENAQNVSAIDYNSFVSKGSNQISFKEDKIYSGPAEKTFAWNWKNQKWQLLQSRTVFFSNRHQVRVNISIIPHF
jgi:hypothetical protein